MALRLTGGQVHDIAQAEALAAEAQPEALLGDKGYDADAFIESLEVRSIKPVIPPKDAHNVVLVGGPGTGKTHLATAIGVQAIEHHRKRVRFFSTVELVTALEQEKLQGKPGQIAVRLAHSDLVILDELVDRT